jgi:hypothetical protein
MPHTIDLAGDPGFIHVVLHGSMDLPALELAMSDVIAACAAHPGRPILGDTRAAEFAISPTEVYHIASDLATTEVGRVKLAIVDRVRTAFDPPAFFQEIGVHRGMPVERFAEPEAAIRWLSGREAPA